MGIPNTPTSDDIAASAILPRAGYTLSSDQLRGRHKTDGNVLWRWNMLADMGMIKVDIFKNLVTKFTLYVPNFHTLTTQEGFVGVAVVCTSRAVHMLFGGSDRSEGAVAPKTSVSLDERAE